MIPVHCRVKHEPENGLYGDCLRACIASLLELKSEDVPHFHHDNPGAYEANKRLNEFLHAKGYCQFWSFFEGSNSIDDIFSAMDFMNPDVYYLLFHQTISKMDHVVICKGRKVEFDPAWYSSQIDGPNSAGMWGAMVIALK